MDRSYYEQLGVTEDADIEVLDAAYRALMKKYHPDACGEHGELRSRQINEAYEVLRDENKRRAYDAQLRKPRKPSTTLPSDPPPPRPGGPNNERQQPPTKQCPDCAETIQSDARVCRFCGYSFDRKRAAPPPDPQSHRRPWLFALGIVALVLLLWLLGFCSITRDPNTELAPASDLTGNRPGSANADRSDADDASRPATPTAADDSQIAGICKEGSSIAEGPADANISNNATAFDCDVMAAAINTDTGQVTFTFASQRGGNAPLVAFDGGLDEKNLLTVERVIISGSNPMRADEGYCRLFFRGGASEGQLTDITDVVCGARITHDGQAIVPKIIFSAQ